MKTEGWSTCCVVSQADHLELGIRICLAQWTLGDTHVQRIESVTTKNTTKRENERIVRQMLVNDTVIRFMIQFAVETSRFTNRFQTPCGSVSAIPAPFSCIVFNTEASATPTTVVPSLRLWNAKDWQNVVLSDESWLVLGTGDNRSRLWRLSGEQYKSIMLSYDTLPHSRRNGRWAKAHASICSLLWYMKLTVHRYVDEIFQPHVGPFLNDFPLVIFKQENTHPHRARFAQDFLLHINPLNANAPVARTTIDFFFSKI